MARTGVRALRGVMALLEEEKWHGYRPEKTAPSFMHGGSRWICKGTAYYLDKLPGGANHARHGRLQTVGRKPRRSSS